MSTVQQKIVEAIVDELFGRDLVLDGEEWTCEEWVVGKVLLNGETLLYLEATHGKRQLFVKLSAEVVEP